MPIILSVNGQKHSIDNAAADVPLLWVLRDMVGMTGTKFGCGVGLCGACGVLIGGQRFFSCQTPLRAVIGRDVTTIEGLGDDPHGAALQQVWEVLTGIFSRWALVPSHNLIHFVLAN